MSRSVPSSPGDRKQGSIPIVGSAESLVGRVSIKKAVSLFFNHLTSTSLQFYFPLFKSAGFARPRPRQVL